MNSDIRLVVEWWFYILLIGIIFLPISLKLFKNFYDKGYIFSKSLGIAIFTYIVFVLGIIHALSFGRLSIAIILSILAAISFIFAYKSKTKLNKKYISIFIFEEILFLISLLFWSFIKGFQPDIRGLEKFMDFGFINSILRTRYFPPVDMWFPPFSINYYYFGHLVTAMLTKLTGITPFITFNLMLATIFAFTVTSGFSIVSNLSFFVFNKRKTTILSGLLGGILVSLGGNLHTIYTLFIPYNPPDNPVPFWKLAFNPQGFPNNYWYPNATRFIPFTIHEFPSYSFVVSDLHGHVLDIPFVFLTLALILSLFISKKISILNTVIISFLLAVMYMTNAWDGIIYFMLFAIVIMVIHIGILKRVKNKKRFSAFALLRSLHNKKKYFIESLKYIILVGFGYTIFSFPFNLFFKPFVSGIGVVCAPSFLTKIGKIGPFLFEANHCQRSPLWMIAILYGFFYIFAIPFLLNIFQDKKPQKIIIYVLSLIFLSTILIITPEFIYAKDIYPAHYRANTMFKLGYQAFIMMSLVAAFSITYLLNKGRRIVWVFISILVLPFILIYPYFAVNSYFADLKNYVGINGISYLKTLYPDDYSAILWIQKNIKNQPVMVEAQSDSYTDYERISANTGLPTILGWTVHEWLWRGDYSYPQSRLDDIRSFYEDDINSTIRLIKKYHVSYVYIGTLERTKYPLLNEDKFKNLGKVIYQKGNTKIYKINAS